MKVEVLLEYVQGKIQGLAGTVRYDLPEKLRQELKELAEVIEKAK